MYYTKYVLIACGALALLVGCKEETVTATAPPETNIPTPEPEPENPTPEPEPENPTPEPEPENELGNLLALEFSLSPAGAGAIPAHSKASVLVRGTYSNGQQVDLTDQVLLMSNSERIGVDNLTKRLQAMGYNGDNGTAQITAEYRGIRSNTLELRVMEGVCDSGTPEVDVKSTGDRECLKVVELDGGRTMFTMTPSLRFLWGLGYGRDNTSDNAGRTYSVEKTAQSESAEWLGSGYALFRRDGLGLELNFENFNPTSLNGQGERYCADLAQMEFNGRNNWRIPSVSQLNLLTDVNMRRANSAGDGEYLWETQGIVLGWHFWSTAARVQLQVGGGPSAGAYSMDIGNARKDDQTLLSATVSRGVACISVPE
ncbi:TPA: hypothetical protein I7136_08515 [Vibrio vulnificus]|nr:hypothetical protein [Vibrio vulnificus]